jgi:hypothetical protein
MNKKQDKQIELERNENHIKILKADLLMLGHNLSEHAKNAINEKVGALELQNEMIEGYLEAFEE